MQLTTLLGLLPITLFSAVVAGVPSGSCPAKPPGSQHSCNTPANRACWAPGFDINTDYEEKTPITGVTRKYKFVITEHDNFVGADGVTRGKSMLINGQYPGPTVVADWGDKVEVEVINKLQTNGTGIHWHGVRQLNNNIHDGAPGVTECPIPPGSSKTYKFLVTQHGTSWYHTHFSAQYGYGVTGSIQFNGPASANYDIDLGTFPIADWYYGGIDDILLRVMDPTNPFIPGLPGSPPPSDNIFFNGTNINPSGAGGQYAKVVITPGKTHRLRLINPSVDNTFTVSIVGHSFTIIETDFVPVTPVTVDSVYLGVGQRSDILINANKDVGNYWINVTFSSTLVCGASNNPAPAAILAYEGASNELPTDAGTPPAESLCTDSLAYVPIISRSAPAQEFSVTPDDTLPVTFDVDTNVTKVFWQVNGSNIAVQWDKPTLEYVQEGNTSFPRSENVVTVTSENKWAFWVINSFAPIPHPMHLHGHDFLILGQSAPLANPLSNSSAPRPFDPATDGPSLKFNNPTRRDTTLLPGFGWLVVAFRSDNPGSWLFHCHIAWHVAQGLSVQFLERVDDIPSSMDLTELNDNCANWKNYFPAHDPFQQTDSGL